MLPDKKELRKRILLRLMSSGTTLFPFLAGVTVLLGTWVVSPERAGIPVFLALCCILGACGTFITRLMLGSEKIGNEIIQEMQQEARQAREKGLDDLDKRLSKDGDARTRQYLRDLRALMSRLEGFRQDARSGFSGMNLYSTIEVISKVEDLFNVSVESLERTLKLGSTAKQVSSAEVKRSILAVREELMTEVRKSIEQLGKILAGIQKLGISDASGSNLAHIRTELDRSIKDAQAVQDQVASWKASFEDTGRIPDTGRPAETEFLNKADDAANPTEQRKETDHA